MRELANEILFDINEVLGEQVITNKEVEALVPLISEKINSRFKQRYSRTIKLYKMENQNLTDYIKTMIVDPHSSGDPAYEDDYI